jgi:hypothetical protein
VEDLVKFQIRAEAARALRRAGVFHCNSREQKFKLLEIIPMRIAQMNGLRVGFPPRIELLAETELRVRNQRVSGLLDIASKTILIAGWQTPERKRFTLCHEIAHYYLHEMSQPHRDFDNVGPSRQEEREADCFAGELLMPSDLLKREFLDRFLEPITPANEALAFWIEEAGFSREAFYGDVRTRATIIAQVRSIYGRSFCPLALQFSVSKLAMARQLIDLGLVH